MKYETARSIAATPERVWGRLIDVESWPKWIESYTSIKQAEDGELHVGSRVKIKQPGLRTTVWTVTDLDAGHSFEWESRTFGVRTIATHVVTPEHTTNGTRLVLSFNQRGALAGVVGLLLSTKIRHSVDNEATGLKTASELMKRT